MNHKANCHALLDFIDTIPDDQYDHSDFTCGTKHCLLGWAAVAGIGGLTNPKWPALGSTSMSAAANTVFGKNAYRHVFSTMCNTEYRSNWTRSDARAALVRHMENLP